MLKILGLGTDALISHCCRYSAVLNTYAVPAVYQLQALVLATIYQLADSGRNPRRTLYMPCDLPISTGLAGRAHCLRQRPSEAFDLTISDRRLDGGPSPVTAFRTSLPAQSPRPRRAGTGSVFRLTSLVSVQCFCGAVTDVAPAIAHAYAAHDMFKIQVTYGNRKPIVDVYDTTVR